MSPLKSKTLLLFVILFLHVSLLDLFYVTYSGLVFLWLENAQLDTVLVHFLTAILTTALYLLLIKAKELTKANEIKVNEKFWLASSLVLVFSIGYLLV